VSYTFSLPSSDHLVALWTAGAAVEHNPGVPITLTLPGLTDHWVVGHDILHGFAREMVASEEDGNLVVRGLLAKDYPMLLRLISPKRVRLPVVPGGRSQ
jgi:hypothetical protein